MIDYRRTGAHETAHLLKALAHPVRLRILGVLRDGEECVCHLEAALGLRQAYISQHLTVLREAGLVSVRRDGWNVFYRVSAKGILDVTGAAAMIATRGTARDAMLIEARPSRCPCPKCDNERAAKLDVVNLPKNAN